MNQLVLERRNAQPLRIIRIVERSVHVDEEIVDLFLLQAIIGKAILFDPRIKNLNIVTVGLNCFLRFMLDLHHISPIHFSCSTTRLACLSGCCHLSILMLTPQIVNDVDAGNLQNLWFNLFFLFSTTLIDSAPLSAATPSPVIYLHSRHLPI